VGGREIGETTGRVEKNLVCQNLTSLFRQIPMQIHVSFVQFGLWTPGGEFCLGQQQAGHWRIRFHKVMVGQDLAGSKTSAERCLIKRLYGVSVCRFLARSCAFGYANGSPAPLLYVRDQICLALFGGGGDGIKSRTLGIVVHAVAS